MSKKVSREEFEKFLADYPRKLEDHGVYFCTPPILEYHDFSIGNPYQKPSSLVAYERMNASWGGATGKEESDYYLEEPDGEVQKSKIGQETK